MGADAPQTHYANAAKNVHIAYQVFGSGPQDLVFVPPFLSNVDVWWEFPSAARFWNRIGEFSRVILLDKRGTGLSDRLSTVETPEERMDDIRAVMDAVGSTSATIFAGSEGCSIAILFGTTYPDRTNGLILWGGIARYLPAPDYPWSLSDELYAKLIQMAASNWGTGFMAQFMLPSRAEEPAVREWFGRYERASASPGGLATHLFNNTSLDVRAILPLIRVRTLILHATDDMFVPVGNSRYLASHIPGAKYVEFPGKDHFFFDDSIVLEEIEEFLTGARHVGTADRVLATLLIVELMTGAQTGTRLNDDSRRDAIQRFMVVGRGQLERHRGRDQGASGDRLIAAFDGPARAIYCAQAIVRAGQELGLAVRVGLHSGECDQAAGKVSGVALQVAAAVKDQAAPGEIAVSSTVRDLVAGSGIVFEDRGQFRLPKLDTDWGVQVVVDPKRPSPPASKADPARLNFEATVAKVVGGPITAAIPPLSKRESEVALLVAAGRTNRQIAGRLFLAERTVEWHVEQILAKLGFTNRAQVASWISLRTTAGGT